MFVAAFSNHFFYFPHVVINFLEQEYELSGLVEITKSRNGGVVSPKDKMKVTGLSR